VAAGADALVVQGPDAGGHRGTFDPGRSPGKESLDSLLSAICAAHDVPVVAAGGLSSAADVRRVLGLGARAAQAGTALLLADEAGTDPVHRQALSDPRFTHTVVTCAFSGRYARGLANDFTDRYDPVAPLGYPEVNQMTGPIRRAAVAAGDPHGTNLWAGTGWRGISAGGTADIVAALAQEVR
jgi:nitronate monooxygenase